MTEIPITFLDRRGEPTSDHINGAPCVQVVLFDYGPGHIPKGLLDVPLHWALIDTGADHVYADPSVLRQVAAQYWGTASVNAEGAESTVHRGFVVFPTINFGSEVAIISREFRAKGNPYTMAIGRAVLNEFDLLYGGHGRPSKLTKVD